MWITDMFGKVVNALFPKIGIEKAIGAQVAVSSRMEIAIQLWSDMYIDEPPWKNNNCMTMNLPAAIAHEFARLITLENEYVVSGSPFADYLNKQLHRDLKNFKQMAELYCAKGGIALKPYVNGKNIELDFTQAESFYPTDFDSNGKVTGAIFVDQVRMGRYVFTRLEMHKFLPNQMVMVPSETEGGEPQMKQTNTYTVENKAYKSEEIFNVTSDDDMYSSVKNPFHEEVPLSSVPQWSSLSPFEELYDIEKPLFVYIKVPAANNVDTKSPLGTSVYARAVDAIRNADEQYSESKYEFEALEAAIDADADLFKKMKDGTTILPVGKERVFRTYEARQGDNAQPFIREFAPDFRDESLFNGLDHYLKIVEFLCELTYGTISDPTSVEKTATEILASKQRSYSAVSNMQSAWDEGMHDLVYAMSVYAGMYETEVVPYGAYELSITWGDGILEDVDKEYQRRWAMVQAGKLRPEKFISWYFGCSEEEALEMMPSQRPLNFFEEEE